MRGSGSVLVVYGGIYCHDASVNQSIPTGVRYTVVTGFTDNNISRNCTPDVANNKIIVTKPGIYQVSASVNWQSGTNGVTWRCSPFLNNAKQDPLHFKRKTSNANDSGSASLTGPISVSVASSDLDFRIRHDNGASVNFVPEYMNFNIVYLGRII